MVEVWLKIAQHSDKTCSELGRWMHLHHRLHMGPVKVWDFTSVEARVLGSLVLVLVDVAVGISDRGGGTAIGHELSKSDHVWSQVNQCLLVSLLENIARAWTEVATLVQQSQVSRELLKGEVGQDAIESRLQVLVLDVLLLNVGATSGIHDVDQMIPGHAVDIQSE